MSYCRWSTDDFRCDLYIYESVYDCWTIHVAGSRYPEGMPPSPKMVPIDLPSAGETFNLPTPGECADKVEELLGLGYHCPPGVVETLREEQVEMDSCDSNSDPKGEKP